jgi:hypothetical protein
MAANVGKTVAKVIGTVTNLFDQGQLASVVGDSLKLGFAKAINFLSKALFATIATVGTRLQNNFKSAGIILSEILLNERLLSGIVGVFKFIALEFIRSIQNLLPDVFKSSEKELDDMRFSGILAKRGASMDFQAFGREIVEPLGKIVAIQTDSRKEFDKNFSKGVDIFNIGEMTEDLAAKIKPAIPKEEAKAKGETSTAAVAIKKLLESITTSAARGFSSIKQARGQQISSLASHGGGRGFTGAMSGLTKAALDGNKLLTQIVTNTGNMQTGLG